MSGIYVVVKFGRADDIAQHLDPVMSFIGSDNIRVIITFADVYQGQENCDGESLKAALNHLLDIPSPNIAIVGKGTSANDIEDFIVATMHQPIELKITEQQIAALTSLSHCKRKFNKMINEVYAKIEAATVSCREIGLQPRNHETDTAIIDTQRLTTEMVEASKENIFRAAADLDPEQQNVVYGRIGLTLTMRLKEFVEATNKYLSRDLTDPSDPMNLYKKCNHCGAVWIKTEGCDGETVCGNVPSSDIRHYEGGLTVEFATNETNKWFVRYLLDGIEIVIAELPYRLARKLRVSKSQTNQSHSKRDGAMFEAGCQRQISWNTMIPLGPEEIRCLATVELRHRGAHEEAQRDAFHQKLMQKEAINLRLMEEMKLSD